MPPPPSTTDPAALTPAQREAQLVGSATTSISAVASTATGLVREALGAAQDARLAEAHAAALRVAAAATRLDMLAAAVGEADAALGAFQLAARQTAAGLTDRALATLTAAQGRLAAAMGAGALFGGSPALAEKIRLARAANDGVVNDLTVALRPLTAPALWTALGSDCGRWTALTDTARDGALADIGMATAAQRDAAKATLAAACTPPAPDDGPTWLDRMHMACADWRAMLAATRADTLRARGVSDADLPRVVAALDAACPATPAASSPADRARAVIGRNVLTCAAWAALSATARAGLAAATPDVAAADVPAVTAAVTAALGACAPPAAAPIPGWVKAGAVVAAALAAAKLGGVSITRRA